MRETLLAVAPLLPFCFIALHVLIRKDPERLAAYTQSLYGLFLCLLALPALAPNAAETVVGGAAFAMPGSVMSVRLVLSLNARNAGFVLLLGLCLPLVFTLVRVSRSASASFYVAANILVAGLLGVFIADGLLLFYFFWELALVGAYFWIGLHGVASPGGTSVYGTLMRFVLITLLGSLPMLLSIALVVLPSGDLGIAALPEAVAQLAPARRGVAFLGFLLAFAVKLPIVGLHGWLRETYVVAPARCRALMSAVMSKMGAYGLLIVLAPAFHAEFAHWEPLLLGVASAGVIYGGLLCLARPDFSSILAYSSLAHLSLIALGAFAGARGDASALTAGVFQVLNHGLIMALLFALESRISEDGRPIDVHSVGGLRQDQRRLAALMLVGIFAAASLPGLSSFAGEVLVYFAAFRISPWYTFTAALGALITAAGLIRAYHHAFLGPKRGDLPQARDLRISEMSVGLAVVAVWLLLGLYPMLFVGPVEKAFAMATGGAP